MENTLYHLAACRTLSKWILMLFLDVVGVGLICGTLSKMDANLQMGNLPKCHQSHKVPPMPGFHYFSQPWLYHKHQANLLNLLMTIGRYWKRSRANKIL